IVSLSFFFFQAEDGIRDKLVTGVQTCALPISSCTAARNFSSLNGLIKKATGPMAMAVARAARSSRAVITITRGRGETAHIRARRSEERRVGKECRSWGAREE